MTIAIQTTNAALAALESLAGSSNAGQGGGARIGGAPASLLDATTGSGGNQSSTIFDVSGGASTSLGGLIGGFSSAASAVDAALTAGGGVQNLLSQLQQAAKIASDPTLTSEQLSQLDAGFKAGLSQIQQTIAGASVDGANLLAGQSPTGAPASLTAYNLSLGGPLIAVGANASLSDPTTAEGLASELGQASQNVSQVMGQIAAQGQAIQNHLALVSQAANALAPGVASGVSGVLDGDGARLQALHVQQQLAGGGQSISNQSPQSILALFAS